MSKPDEKPVNEITMTRNSTAGGKFRARGDVLTIGKDIEKNDARQLLRSGKALPGAQTRIAEEAAAEKKSAEAAQLKAADSSAAKVAELEKQLADAEDDAADEQERAEAAEKRAAEAEKRAADAEKRAAEAEKALVAAKKNGK